MESEREIPEVKEETEGLKRELTEEEKQILEEMVPDEETRSRLGQDVVDMLIRAKQEESEKSPKKREAA